MYSIANYLSTLCLLLTAVQCSVIKRVNDSAYQPRPYTINVNSSFIQQTRSKVANYRPTLDIDQPAWFDGPPASNISDVASYWVNSFDWFAFQDQLNNNFSHYLTTVPPPGGSYNRSVDLHFIHQASSRKDAIPLLMLHGWPSTSLEWARVIPSLVNPQNASLPAFNVVAPDLPGYGFSPAPLAPGLGREEHAAVFASLMAQLGYDRYAVYSTDLGFVVAQGMVTKYPSRIVNHISDFYIVFPNATDLQRAAANRTTAEESAYLSAVNAFLANHSAYSAIHSTLPLSLAYALNDSPVGFLAWMWQLVFTVGDSIQQAPFELVTRALLLFINGVYGNIRSYKELFAPANFGAPLTNVPTSVLQFGGTNNYPEITNFNFVPRDWVQRTANVTYFSRHPVGSHFPAESQPQLVIEDIRNIFAR